MPPASPFPRTSATSFRVKGEEFAEGFVMDLAASGSRYRIRLDLPRPADPGEAYLIFYASFYQEGARESMIETGLSVSAKGWNLLSKITGQKQGPDVLFTGDDPRNHAPIDFVVNFEPQGHGRALVQGSAAGRTRLDPISHYGPIARARLIIAAANNKSGHFGRAGVSLLDIDHKPPSSPGDLIWMPGAQLAKAQSRLQLLERTSSGFVCELPAAATTKAR